MNNTLLKNGLIMDGTGEKAYQGDVLIKDGKVYVSKTPIQADCPTFDCTGKAISPGFIDSHSHHDNFVAASNNEPLVEPFIRQGITTNIAGNCGYSAAGVVANSPTRKDGVVFAAKEEGKYELPFSTYAEYFDYLRKVGLQQNMAMFAGHGTAMTSVTGLTPKGASTPEQKQQIAALLNEGMDAGCKGISFGLGYRPGDFIPDSEVREISELAIKRNKLISVHSRILGSNAPKLYGTDFSIPHNVRWHKEFLELFRDSGARLQISHLLFVGRKAWPSYDQMFEMFDDMVDNGGMDLWFDMYSYIQGGTSIAIRMPQFFYDNLPHIYEDESLWPQLEKEMQAINEGRGILDHDVMLCDSLFDGYQDCKGMFMDEICEAKNISLAQLYLDLYKNSGGYAKIYLMIEQPEENVPKQMLHKRALYMTDAWVEPKSLQNPCAYGAMPKFLRLSRELGKQSMEMTVAKMTGRAATRFDLHGRGFLKDGYAADVVVFDPATVADTATPKDPERYPIGIHHVFVNGAHMLNEGVFSG
ncbi:hypothetical protein LJB83_02455, partial [Clostridia bacterium OttesenSCG-928-F22]|nr:hypothetical protein [Clostridia bacterium OttesenSCG-928-F22]